MLPQAAALILGFVFASVLIPRVIQFARSNSVLDFPDNERRLHAEPVPRLGGVAIFIAVALAIGLVFLWDSFDDSFTIPLSPMRPGLIIGCLIVFVTGIVDDVRGVSPSLKLIFQTVAALMVVLYGFRVNLVTLTGDATVSLGIASIPITVFWIVGMTNAFNLIDGVDGLAGTCALIGLSACTAVDIYLHGSSVIVMRLAVFGAVAAFLRFNRAPAKIFLGDSGSMVLGYFLSICTVTSSTVSGGVTYALIPLFVLAYPLADTLIAMARRWLRGHRFSRADGRHVHHQILALGLSPSKTVFVLGLFFGSVAVMGTSIVLAPPRVTLAIGVAGLVLMFAIFCYGVKWLRYSEFIELGASVTSVLFNARSHVRNKVIAGEIGERLSTASSLDELKAMLADSASEFKLIEIGIIDGNPHFHGPSARQISPLANRPFRVDYPIAWEENGETREVVLRLWCERPTERQHVGAERIASRLAGALEEWVRGHPGVFAAPALEPRRSAPAGLHAFG